MPVTYNKVSRQQLAAVAETMLKAGEKLTQALMMMQQYQMDEAYLPWTDATLRSVNAVVALGTQAMAEIDEQHASRQLGLPSRHEKQKKKTAYNQQWREDKAAKKGKNKDA